MSETRNRDRLLLVVSICLLWITLVIIGVSLTLGPTAFRPSWSWLLWSLLIAGIELLPVPAWRGLTISVGFPVLVMVAILYPPGAAGAMLLVAAQEGADSVATEMKRPLPEVSSPLIRRFHPGQSATSLKFIHRWTPSSCRAA